jgi:hypothetical protein
MGGNPLYFRLFLSVYFICLFYFLVFLLTFLLYFFMMPIFITQLELCFVFQDMRFCVKVWGSTTSPTFLYLYLYIGNNVLFKFRGRKNILLSYCTYYNCLIMLSLRIWLNFNSDLYFIGELNMMNT